MYTTDVKGQLDALVTKSEQFKDATNKYVFVDEWDPTIFKASIARTGTVNRVPFKRLLCYVKRVMNAKVEIGGAFFTPLGETPLDDRNRKSVKLILEIPYGNKTITIMPDGLIRLSDPFEFWDGIPASMYRSLDDGFWGAAWLRSIDVNASSEGTYWLLAPDMLHVGKDSMVYQHTPPQKTISFHKLMQDYLLPLKAPKVVPTVVRVKPKKKIVNPYSVFEEINAGQQVEKTNLSSYLGSCAHWYASYKKKPNTSAAEKKYATLIPEICKEMGKNLLQGIANIAYTERDVYWPTQVGPRSDRKYAHSRVDLVAKEGDEYHVWEFKTRWGNWNKQVANMDYTQAMLYAHMLKKSKTADNVTKVHIRYIMQEGAEFVIFTFTYPVTAAAIRQLKRRA